MEYMQPFNPQVVPQPQDSQDNQSSSGFPIRRSRSIELRASKLYPTCECIKRNGLQHACQRTECQGKSCCMTKSGPTCNPSGFAQKQANNNMASSNDKSKLGDTNAAKNCEMPFTSDPASTGDFSEIKDFDPKMYGQIYHGANPMQIPYNQYSPVPMMNQPVLAYPQNYAGIPVLPPTMTAQPQMTGTSKSSENFKPEKQNQAETNSMQAFSGMVQNLGGNPAPISAITPMPTIHPFPGSNACHSTMPIGQPYTFPGQIFTPFNGSVNSFNPYSPNMPSYLPCNASTGASVSSGIPVGTMQ